MKKMIRRKKNKSRAVSILMAFVMVITLLGGIAPISVKASQPEPEKKEVTITDRPQTTTYDGKSYDLSQLFVMPEGHGDITYEIREGTGTGTISGQELFITSFGTFTIKVTTAETDEYKTGGATSKLTVNKGRLVRPTGKTLVYNGENQTGVEDGEMYDTVDGTGINAGNYSATVKLTDAAKKLYGWNVGSGVPDEDQIIPWAIVSAAPRIAVNPTASAITYGESLSKSNLSGGKATLGNTEAEVAGGFKWKDDTVKPNMDSTNQQVIFIPTDTKNYEPVEFEVSVTINGVTPGIDENPTASDITYGQSLNESSLTGGTAKVDGDIIDGTFTWKDNTVVPDAGSSQQTVIFTPKSNNYSTVELNVPISVNKVTLNPIVASVAEKTYDGTTNCSGTLSFEGGVGNEVPTASGTFTWTKSSAGTSKIDVTGITLDEVWKNKYQLATTELKDALTPAVVIAPRPVEIIWDYSKAFVYNGETQSVIPTVNNVIGSDVVNPITERGSGTDAGNYTARVTQLSNRNYTLEGASGTTLNWQILGIVNFDADGGSPAPGGQNVAIDDKVTEPGTITKEGYVFGGWYDDGRKWDFGIDLITQNETTLKAMWLDTDKALTSFSLGGQNGTIDEAGGTIVISLPEGTTLDELVATFTAGNGATVKIGDMVQESGVTTNDFSNDIVYSVYSQGEPDTNPKNYTVTVKLAAAPVIGGIVNGETYFTTQVATITGDQVINVTLNGNPVSTNAVTLTGNTEQKYNVVATNALGVRSEITITMRPISTLAEPINALNVGNVKSSDRATVEETKAKVSGIDITNATEEERAALKSIAEKCDSLIAKMNQIDKDKEAAETADKALTSFSLGGQNGTIDEAGGTIVVSLPEGTKLDELAATFTAGNGATVKIGDMIQESGVTTNDFSNAVVYSVYSQGEPDTNPKNYTVTVKLAAAPVIGGIVNGETYFTTQVATITGDQVTSVTLNGNPVSTNAVTLTGNTEQKYNVVATNALGVRSEITITMRPISTLAEPINALNVGNVKSSDRATVEAVKAKVSGIDITNATEEERAALKSIGEKCDSLIAKMNQIDKDKETAETAKDKKTQAKEVKSVATGDSSNFTEPLLLSIFALLVGGGCILRRKKYEK
ncbi:MAG: InlB B-repeat-containing protein [Hespellia sp.]|nr:InlB B-repeat-containing protein [Hespellia sp.]